MADFTNEKTEYELELELESPHPWLTFSKCVTTFVPLLVVCYIYPLTSVMDQSKNIPHFKNQQKNHMLFSNYSISYVVTFQ